MSIGWWTESTTFLVRRLTTSSPLCQYQSWSWGHTGLPLNIVTDYAAGAWHSVAQHAYQCTATEHRH